MKTLLYFTFLIVLTECRSDHRIYSLPLDTHNNIMTNRGKMSNKIRLNDFEIKPQDYNDSSFTDTIDSKSYFFVSSPVCFADYQKLTKRYSDNEIKANRIFQHTNFDKKSYEIDNLARYHNLIQNDSNCYYLKNRDNSIDTLCDNRFTNSHIHYYRYYFADYNEEFNYYIFFVENEDLMRIIYDAKTGKNYSFFSYPIIYNKKILTSIDDMEMGGYTPKLAAWEITDDTITLIWSIESWKSYWWPTNALWYNDSLIYYEHNLNIKDKSGRSNHKMYLRKLEIFKK